jgi:hypothetical protein
VLRADSGSTGVVVQGHALTIETPAGAASISADATGIVIEDLTLTNLNVTTAMTAASATIAALTATALTATAASVNGAAVLTTGTPFVYANASAWSVSSLLYLGDYATNETVVAVVLCTEGAHALTFACAPAAQIVFWALTSSDPSDQ